MIRANVDSTTSMSDDELEITKGEYAGKLAEWYATADVYVYHDKGDRDTPPCTDYEFAGLTYVEFSIGEGKEYVTQNEASSELIEIVTDMVREIVQAALENGDLEVEHHEE
jgi:hypothetical protein